MDKTSLEDAEPHKVNHMDIVLQGQTAVTAYFSGNQLLLFAVVGQYTTTDRATIVGLLDHLLWSGHTVCTVCRW